MNHSEGSFFSGRKFLYKTTLFVLFVIALLVRIPFMLDQPRNFHTGRQFHNMLMTRSLYYDWAQPQVENEKIRFNAVLSGKRQEPLEPLIINSAVAAAYKIVGKESEALGRFVYALAWLLGAPFFYWIARRVTSREGALIAYGFYLFLPYGVLISTSFQVDPFMMSVSLAALFYQLRYFDQPNTKRLLLASAVSALALLVKPLCVFSLFGVFVGLSLLTQNGKNLFQKKDGLVFSFFCFTPLILFYVGRIVQGGFMQYQVKVSFIPELIMTASFWKDWSARVGDVFGYSAFTASLLGFFFSKRPLGLVLMGSLLGAYVIFGLFFTFQIHTHDYYQVLLIPIVCLGLGCLYQGVVQALSSKIKFWRVLILFALVSLMGLSLQKTIKIHKHHVMNGFEEKVRIAKEIGEKTNYTSNAIFLAKYWRHTKILNYYGNVSGFYWPDRDGFDLEKIGKIKPQSVAERFQNLEQKFTPEFFIIADFPEFESQPELRAFLDGNYRRWLETKDYLIYDLREL